MASCSFPQCYVPCETCTAIKTDPIELELMKHCKVCDEIKSDATYVASLQGWRCNDCCIVDTGVHKTLKEVTI